MYMKIERKLTKYDKIINYHVPKEENKQCYGL